MKTMSAVVDESLFLERHGRGAVGRLRRAGDAARRDRPLRRDVVHGGAADARDRHPHGARRRAQLGAVAGAEGGGADGRRRRRRRPAAGDRAQPRRPVAVFDCPRTIRSRSPAPPRSSRRRARSPAISRRGAPRRVDPMLALPDGRSRVSAFYDRSRCDRDRRRAAASAAISAAASPRPAPTSRFSRAARTSRRCARAASASTARRATSICRTSTPSAIRPRSARSTSCLFAVKLYDTEQALALLPPLSDRTPPCSASERRRQRRRGDAAQSDAITRPAAPATCRR